MILVKLMKHRIKGASRQKMKRKKKKTTKLRRLPKRSVVVRRKPKDLVWDTENWIKHSTPVHNPPEQYFKPFHHNEVITYYQAKGLDDPVHDGFLERTVHSRPAYAAIIKYGRVWGKNGVAFTPDNRLLADVSLEFSWDYFVANQHSLFRKWKEYPLKTTASTVGLLTHTSSENYFHWLFDVLPRIDLLRRCGRTIDKFILRGTQKPFQDETLQLMGIPKEKRMYTDMHFHLQARRLVIPSLIGQFTWSTQHYPLPVTYSHWACQFVRHELMVKPNIHGSGEFERIYVSRGDAEQRRLLNEEEILAKLVPLGFTVIDPGKMSVKDQIRSFASAKWVVAPHGASLANLAFCLPGTKVVELFSPIYTPGYFWMLSNHLGLDYYYLIGDDYVILPKSWAGGSHFHVDPNRFSRLLQRAKIE